MNDINRNETELLQFFNSAGCKPFLYDKPLYKFVTLEGAKNILKLNRLKYTNPTNFVDSLELSLDCFEISNQESVISKFLLRHNTMEFVNNLNNVQKGIMKDNFNDIFLKHLNNLRSQVGVLCMTENNDDNKMWENYADKSKGLCIEFDFTIYNQIRKPNFIFMYVKYVDELEKFDFIDQPQVALLNWIISKNATSYSYEREVRTVELNNPDFKPFKKECLKSITFGKSCSQSDKDTITELASKYNYLINFSDQ